MNKEILNEDDAFILGNICGIAISAGKGDEVKSLYRCLQTQRPDNAGGYIFEAMHLQQSGEVLTAIELLRDSGAIKLEKNGAEAISLYALLLIQDNQNEAAFKLAKHACSADMTISESARDVFEKIVEEFESSEKAYGN